MDLFKHRQFRHFKTARLGHITCLSGKSSVFEKVRHWQRNIRRTFVSLTFLMTVLSTFQFAESGCCRGPGQWLRNYSIHVVKPNSNANAQEHLISPIPADTLSLDV